MKTGGGLLRVWAVAIVLAALLGACAGDDPADSAPATPAPSASGGERYDSLEEVAEAAECKELQDVGTANNPGLEEFGICYIGRANIDIYLTSQRGLWEHIADQFPSVLGPNWVIVSPTGPSGARIVHERLGGELKIPPTPAPSKG